MPKKEARGARKEIELASPLREGPQGYQQSRFQSIYTMGEIIKSLEHWNDIRVYAKTMHDISTVTDDDLRDAAFQHLDEYIKEEQDKAKTETEKGRALFRACMRIQGDITAFYDEYVGVTHRLAIGVIEGPPEQEEEEDAKLDAPAEAIRTEPAPSGSGEPCAAVCEDGHQSV